MFATGEPLSSNMSVSSSGPLSFTVDTFEVHWNLWDYNYVSHSVLKFDGFGVACHFGILLCY